MCIFNQKSVAMTRLFAVLLLTTSLFCACRQNNSNKAPHTPVMGIDSVTGAPIRLPNPWKNAGCELVSDPEVIKLFAVDPKRDAFNARTLPNRGFCLRSWMKPDWKERESGNEKPGAVYREFKNTLVTQVLDYGTELVSKDQFELVRRDQRNVYEEEVPDLGDGALWSTSTTSLLVKKGHLVVKITLDYTDKPHDNLEMAKEVAKLALNKMI